MTKRVKGLYKIVRHFYPSLQRRPRVIKSNLTLQEAQAWCRDPKTRKEGVYFDGYSQQ